MSGTLQNIRFFVAAYEEGSFTAAAVREHATQPGVSHHVRHLEDMLSVQLFIREKNALIPTPAGENYYHRCIKVLRAYDEANHAMRPYAGAVGEHITVGLIPALTRYAMGPALSRYMERRPNVTIQVVEGYTPALADKVAAGDIDFAITSNFGNVDGLQARRLFETSEFLICKRESSAEEVNEIELPSAGALKLIWPDTTNVHRGVLGAYIRDNDVQLMASLEINSVLGTLDMVSNSDWATIMPLVMLRPNDLKQFRVRKIVNPSFPFPLVLAKPITGVLSSNAEELVEELLSAAQEIEACWQQ